jgi:hypothetical protein
LNTELVARRISNLFNSMVSYLVSNLVSSLVSSWVSKRKAKLSLPITSYRKPASALRTLRRSRRGIETEKVSGRGGTASRPGEKTGVLTWNGSISMGVSPDSPMPNLAHWVSLQEAFCASRGFKRS